MTALPKVQLPTHRMTVDEFIVWSESVPGRYELHGGVVYTMQSERAGHVRKKSRFYNALAGALEKAGLSSTCEAMADGVLVRIDDDTAYEPDAVVYCGAKMDDDDVEVPNPIVIVEVTSPSSGRIDTGEKLHAYFQLPSVRHYLIVNQRKAIVTHHWRKDDGRIETSLIANGFVELEPPGVSLNIEQLFT